VAIEQAAEGIEFADAPFGGGGQAGLDDREAGESFDITPQEPPGRQAPATRRLPASLLDRRPAAADRPFYSGKYRRHGMNLQVIASPGGEILRVSGPLRVRCMT